MCGTISPASHSAPENIAVQTIMQMASDFGTANSGYFFIGIAIAVLVAIFASVLSKRAANRAEFLITLILNSLENNNLATFERDKKNRIIGGGVTVYITGAGALALTGHAPEVLETDNDPAPSVDDIAG